MYLHSRLPALALERMTRATRRWHAAMIAGGTALACLAPTRAIAQDVQFTSAEIAGHVLATDGSPVAGVAVSLIGVSDAESDSSGAFRFPTLPPGTYFLRATRIGAKPVLKNVTIRAGDLVRVDISLSSNAQELTAVVVRADSALTALSDPTGFQRRLRTGQGVFMTGEEIERRHATRTEHLFLGVPSVSVDTGGIVLITRGIISYKSMLFRSKTQFDAQLLDCVGVQVFVDGAQMPQPFDVNTVDTHSIKGIELYRGPATTPPELRSPKTVCGTLAIWTR